MFEILISMAAVLMAVWILVVHTRLLRTERHLIAIVQCPRSVSDRVLAERMQRLEDKCGKCGH